VLKRAVFIYTFRQGTWSDDAGDNVVRAGSGDG